MPQEGQEEQDEKEVTEEEAEEKEGEEEEEESEEEEEESEEESENEEEGGEEEEDEDDPLTELKVENATLRGQIQQIQAQLNGRQRESSSDDDEDEDPLSVVTAETLRKDPVGTIRKALQLQDQKTRKEILSTTSRTRLSMENRQKEEQLLAREFPDLYEDREFNNFAGRLYKDAITDAGVDFPGARYLAAAAAKYLQLKQKGKITEGKPLKLRERTKQATNPKVNGSKSLIKDGGKKDPLHGLNPKQRRAAEKVAKGFGLTLKQVRESYDLGIEEEDKDDF